MAAWHDAQGFALIVAFQTDSQRLVRRPPLTRSFCTVRSHHRGRLRVPIIVADRAFSSLSLTIRSHRCHCLVPSVCVPVYSVQIAKFGPPMHRLDLSIAPRVLPLCTFSTSYTSNPHWPLLSGRSCSVRIVVSLPAARHSPK
jgi:hypothetical protein